jgi:hypothetical protein
MSQGVEIALNGGTTRQTDFEHARQKHAQEWAWPDAVDWKRKTACPVKQPGCVLAHGQ